MKTLSLLAAGLAASLAFAAPASAQLASTGDVGYGHFYGEFQSGQRAAADRNDAVRSDARRVTRTERRAAPQTARDAARFAPATRTTVTPLAYQPVANGL